MGGGEEETEHLTEVSEGDRMQVLPHSQGASEGSGKCQE